MSEVDKRLNRLQDLGKLVKQMKLDPACYGYRFLNCTNSRKISFIGYNTYEGYILQPFFLHDDNEWCWSSDKLYFNSKEEALNWAEYTHLKINWNNEEQFLYKEQCSMIDFYFPAVEV